MLIFVFNNNEQHPDQNQHDRYGLIIVEQGVKHIVKQQSDNRRRQAGYDNLQPHNPCRSIRRNQSLPIDHHNGHNRAKLDDNQEHFHKFRRNIHFDKLIYQNHMSGTADGKPLCNSLNNPEDNRFYNFHLHLAKTLLLSYPCKL